MVVVVWVCVRISLTPLERYQRIAVFDKSAKAVFWNEKT
jgi:hypothetical protein